jgi:NDP-sugar pyrophosphorylase family protein
MDDTGSEKAGWISAGIYLLSHRVVESIPSGRSVSIEREVFPAWVRRGLFGHEAPGPFLDIGTPESYAKATHFFGDWGDPIDALAVTRSRHPRGRDDD